MGVIIQEPALEFSQSAYCPRWHQRVPGLANDLADKVGRKFQPGVKFSLPSLLAQAEEVCGLPRKPCFYRTMAAAQVA